MNINLITWDGSDQYMPVPHRPACIDSEFEWYMHHKTNLLPHLENEIPETYTGQ